MYLCLHACAPMEEIRRNDTWKHLHVSRELGQLPEQQLLLISRCIDDSSAATIHRARASLCSRKTSIDGSTASVYGCVCSDIDPLQPWPDAGEKVIT